MIGGICTVNPIMSLTGTPGAHGTARACVKDAHLAYIYAILMACRGAIEAYMLQIAIISNHQNGRDTHVRQVRVFGPRQDPIKALGQPITFTSPQFNLYATVR